MTAPAPTKGPIGKRRIPLDEETEQRLRLIAERLNFHPNGYIFGPNVTWATRVALSYAKRAGIEPNGDILGKDRRSVKIDTAGLFDDLPVTALSSVLKQSARHYSRKGWPDNAALAGLSDNWVALPESIIREIAIRAFASRRTAEVEAAEVLNTAMAAAIDELPSKLYGEGTRDVRIRLNPELFNRFWHAASWSGRDLNTLLWHHTNRVLMADAPKKAQAPAREEVPE